MRRARRLRMPHGCPGMTAPRRAVVSLLNTPAGLFRWYEEFPLQISDKLAPHGIEHVIAYKDYLPHSIMPARPRLTIHDETQMPDAAWVRATMEPLLARYDQVIVHTHSYQFRLCQVWRLTRGHRQQRWWATEHVTPKPGAWPVNLARRVLQRLRIGFPDRIYGVSETTAQPLRRMFVSKSIGVLRNGRLLPEEMTQFPPRPGAPRRALFVGRLTPEKGVWPLLHAARELATARPDFHLVVVGDGPETAPMQAWIDAHGLGARIVMAGYQSEVRPYYADADFLIVPTDPEQFEEGLGLVAVEAKACALPVLYTRSGGLPETQLEGRTGVLMDPPDAAGIVAAASALMDDPARYHAMREAVREERGRWALSTMTDAYVAEYLAEFARLARG